MSPNIGSLFLGFFSSFLRLFTRSRGPKVERFSYDYPGGTRGPRPSCGHVTPTGPCRIMGNRWWRRNLYLRGREVH